MSKAREEAAYLSITVDLNCDMGESFGPYTLGSDAEVMPLVTSANVACGFHAGDPAVMRRTVRLAAQHGVSVGAHPGYRDLAGFGRRRLACTPDEVYGDVLYQIGALAAVCRAEGLRLRHVKPHGALYHVASTDPEIARALAQAVHAFDAGLLLFAPYASQLEAAGKQAGLRVLCEAFGDRAYQEDATLLPRQLPGAVLHDEAEAVQQVCLMVLEGRVRAATGKMIPILADTICVHGDNPAAVRLLGRIRAALLAQGVSLAAPMGG